MTIKESNKHSTAVEKVELCSKSIQNASDINCNLSPHSLEAEMELLGMLIRDNNNLDQAEKLRREHFYHELHGDIFDAIRGLIDKHCVADVVNISAHLQGKSSFIENGGRDYLKKLENLLTLSTACSRSDVIYDLFRQRCLVDIGKEVVSDAYAMGIMNIQDTIAKAEAKLYNLTSANDKARGFSSLNISISDAVQKFDKVRLEDRPITGIASGFSDLDKLLGGFKNSDLIILAARPSMGKTALAVNIGYNIARRHVASGGIGFFSLEMSSEQIALRVMSMHSGYSARTFSTGRYQSGDNDKRGKAFGDGKRIADDDFANIVNILNEMSDMPFFMDDSPAINIATLYTRARRLKRKQDICAIFVDYLQLVRGHGIAMQTGNRVQEISEVTQGLKAIAKDLNIPVIALSQLSRAVENRDDKRPQLSDLRESGAIEQDADIVAFLYREAYYMERTRPHDPGSLSDQDNAECFKKWEADKAKLKSWESHYNNVYNLAELIVAKNRNGPIGVINLAFERSCTKFSDRVVDVNSFDDCSTSNESMVAMSDKFR